MFRDFLGKMECKKQCLFPNGWVIVDLRSLDTLETQGKQASANVQPCGDIGVDM